MEFSFPVPQVPHIAEKLGHFAIPSEAKKLTLI